MPHVALIVLAVLAVVLLVGRDARRRPGGATVEGPADARSDARPGRMTGTGYDPGSDTGGPPRAAWAPPPYVPPGPRASRPRRTGLVLFWPTLALIVVALGVLGIYDASHAVEVAAYPALALAVTGGMLVVGAFRDGRAGWCCSESCRR